jgi:hypothetical protein
MHGKCSSFTLWIQFKSSRFLLRFYRRNSLAEEDDKREVLRGLEGNGDGGERKADDIGDGS